MTIKKNAILSQDRKHRYMLSRIWDENTGAVVFIGLNPSTADENNDDRTIKKCIKYAKDWGYGGIYMINLFSFRATNPNKMLSALNPTNDENDKYIEKYINIGKKVICAWGNDGSFQDRNNDITNKFKDLYCLKLNQTGQPAHPLYLEDNLKPKLMSELQGWAK